MLGVKYKIRNLNNRFWDSQTLVHSKGDFMSSLVLRRGLYVVVIMSEHENLLGSFERSLRSEKFDAPK